MPDQGRVAFASDFTGAIIIGVVAMALLAIGYLVFEANKISDELTPTSPPKVITIDRIYVDPGTGCEYLGITGAIQRFDRDGKQICRPLETK